MASKMGYTRLSGEPDTASEAFSRALSASLGLPGAEPLANVPEAVSAFHAALKADVEARRPPETGWGDEATARAGGQGAWVECDVEGCANRGWKLWNWRCQSHASGASIPEPDPVVDAPDRDSPRPAILANAEPQATDEERKATAEAVRPALLDFAETRGTRYGACGVCGIRPPKPPRAFRAGRWFCGGCVHIAEAAP